MVLPCVCCLRVWASPAQNYRQTRYIRAFLSQFQILLYVYAERGIPRIANYKRSQERMYFLSYLDNSS